MAPVRGNKRRRKAEENPLVSGYSEEATIEWWDALSKKFAGNPSSSHGLDNFKNAFSMSRKTFCYICSLVKDQMKAKTHFNFTNGDPMSIYDQVALALRRLGTGNTLISIGESFGAHHSIVSQVTWCFIEAIEQQGLCHLQWPSTEQEVTKVKSKFEKIRGLPNCCGAIDTTHIKMQLTSSDKGADNWLDHKKNHSMILQVIVDPDLRFWDIVTGWPGQMTDSLVLQGSNFFKLCQEGEKLNGKRVSLSEETELREYIIGDSGYPLLPWLVTPFQGNKLSENKADFNKRLLATHGVAQRALAKLKERWRMIQGDMWRPDKQKLPRVILVCCILHNIVIDKEDNVSYESTSYDNHDPGYMPEVCEYVDKEGSILRNRLSKYFSGR